MKEIIAMLLLLSVSLDHEQSAACPHTIQKNYLTKDSLCQLR